MKGLHVSWAALCLAGAVWVRAASIGFESAEGYQPGDLAGQPSAGPSWSGATNAFAVVTAGGSQEARVIGGSSERPLRLDWDIGVLERDVSRINFSVKFKFLQAPSATARNLFSVQLFDTNSLNRLVYFTVRTDGLVFYNDLEYTRDVALWTIPAARADGSTFIAAENVACVVSGTLHFAEDRLELFVDGVPQHGYSSNTYDGIVRFTDAGESANPSIGIILTAGDSRTAFKECSIDDLTLALAPSAPAPVVTPAIVPAGGYFVSAVTVTAASADGAVVRYTTDGSAPGPGSPILSTARVLSSNTLFRARAFLPARPASEIASAAFAIVSNQGDDIFSEWLRPFWMNYGVYRETVAFIRETNGLLAQAKLTFPAIAIHSVADAAWLTGQNRTAYTEGSDYTWTNNVMTRPASSAIPFVERSDMFVTTGGQPWRTNPADPLNPGNTWTNPTNSLVTSSEDSDQLRQVEVVYSHNAGWTGSIPGFASAELSNTISKLSQGQEVRILLFGDSITAGRGSSSYGGSGLLGFPPWQPGWPWLFADGLRRIYDNQSVLVRNASIPGDKSSDNRNLVEPEVHAWQPDLVIMAFGMNDAYIGLLNKGITRFKNGMNPRIAAVREVLPQAEILLVSPMLGNPEWNKTTYPFFTTNQLHSGYSSLQEATYELAAAYPNIAVVDVVQVWKEMLGRKGWVYEDLFAGAPLQGWHDMCANGLNHPNDYGHRLYAQSVLAALVPPTELWRHGHFALGELRESSLSGDSADPDADLSANLAEFATCTNPQMLDPDSNQRNDRICLDGDVYQTLSFALAPWAGDIEYVLQTANRLESDSWSDCWSSKDESATEQIVGSVLMESGAEWTTVRDAMSAGDDIRFMRLVFRRGLP